MDQDRYSIRPIRVDDLDSVAGMCWENRETQLRLLEKQEILGFGAWNSEGSRFYLVVGAYSSLEGNDEGPGWWRSEGWLEEDEGHADILANGPHCLGCQGDRSTHWSPDCWILKCAADDHGIESCHQCAEFACERLVQWASRNGKYAQALARLRQMREATA